MMSKFKKLYRDFFGLKEQTNPSVLPKFSDEDIENLNKAKDAYKEMSTAMQGLKYDIRRIRIR
jgi:hypothetical protein